MKPSDSSGESRSAGETAPRRRKVSERHRRAHQPYRLCVAPMMAWTDRHCRFLHRLLAPSARLYTEMVNVDALLRGNRERSLAFSDEEHPVALQIGGSDPHDLAHAARLAASAGFDEVNLNVGCPSSRVQKGAFGACLMRSPDRVATLVSAMRDSVAIPVTVKCRLGIEASASSAPPRKGAFDYALLSDFVGQVADAGSNVFIIHARKAVLNGLTPAQNRSVPPLQPELVERLKRDFPHLVVIYNGGVRDTTTAERHLAWADGVMVGRGAYQNPRWLSRLHAELCAQTPVDLRTAIGGYLAYVDDQRRAGTPLHSMTRHMLTLFNGIAGARRYRQHLTEYDRRPNAGVEVIRAAMSYVLDQNATPFAA